MDLALKRLHVAEHLEENLEALRATNSSLLDRALTAQVNYRSSWNTAGIARVKEELAHSRYRCLCTMRQLFDSGLCPTSPYQVVGMGSI